MPSEYMFHIRNANPGDMRALLDVLTVFSESKTTAEILQHADELGYAVRDRAHFDALPAARDLGLVEDSANRLTAKGEALAQIDRVNPTIFPDIIHLLHYTLWNSTVPAANCFSFSYRTVCKELWNGGSSSSLNRRELAAKVEATANDQFKRPDISLSQKSIGGALDWLYELRPEVISDDSERFVRRSFCPPESLVLAIEHRYRESELDYGANLLLSGAHREALCQTCLLELDALDRVLEYAIAQFSYLEKGVGGGWGQYVTLQGPVAIGRFAQLR